MDEKLPDVLTAPAVDLQIYVKHFYQETDRCVVVSIKIYSLIYVIIYAYY